MSAAVRAFLRAIDSNWSAATETRFRLSIIGSSALMLRTDYVRVTNDSDVIRTTALPGPVEDALLRLAGKGTSLHQKHRLYVDLVPPGLVFLAQAPLWHELAEQLVHFDVEVLDVVDVVVSKLKRFSANDRSDIDQMVQRGHVTHQAFLDRFRQTMDAHFGDEQLPRYAANFNTVERDAFACAETEFELPDWMS